MMQAGSSLIKQNARKKNFVIAGAIVLLALVKVFSAATPSKPAGVTFTDARASLNSASDVAGVENMGAILPAANPQANNAENAANTAPTAITSEPVTALPERIDRRMVSWSQTEKEVLTALDARRVELEKRKQLLDSREAELKVQSATLQERMAELRALTQQAAQLRKATDSQQRARIEQLANVYGSMAPNEAAPLFARLDESIALALLRHMPGKRIGQILSVMDRDRAVHLTKVLSEEGTLSTEGAER